MRKRIILSAGGTGGHLFPAQALAQALQPYAEVLFVASGLGTNQFFDKQLYAYEEIATATFSLSQPWQVLRGGVSICQGTCSALRILKRFAPDLVIGFGSFHTVPILMASLIRRLPFMLHEQNLVPGRVNRFFSPYAQLTALTFSATAQQFKGASQLVHMPCRSQVEQDPWSYYGWQPGAPVLLVYGGSQGAQAINETVLNVAKQLQNYRVLHFIGKHGNPQQIKGVYQEHGITACVKQFEHRMDLALQIADVAICRAGASTVCELISYHVPAILIPYPYAHHHQLHNAQHFTLEAQGGKILLQQDLDDKSLLLALLELDLKNCRNNLKHYCQKQKIENFENIILKQL
ncbi:MAG: undecaprenyldiphospho-muramoylpentapeptide beta-N-acetylglucosaminyltransferase [Verrucomicrobia bacterium]|nr:undecaprenyldiphospho-muramoylpentapeptide beta-N-acetylglucosaminyltransferase [Verrucomicrobiota bacterium]MBS0645098.1 undecaprenyldiphospho-muramoylpentapeptide beta-N-acetylglucosaminyltransferase [Verrucomicrobiota bacterium]